MPNIKTVTVEFRRMVSDNNYGNVTAGAQLEVDLAGEQDDEARALAIRDAEGLARSIVWDLLEDSGNPPVMRVAQGDRVAGGESNRLRWARQHPTPPADG